MLSRFGELSNPSTRYIFCPEAQHVPAWQPESSRHAHRHHQAGGGESSSEVPVAEIQLTDEDDYVEWAPPPQKALGDGASDTAVSVPARRADGAFYFLFCFLVYPLSSVYPPPASKDYTCICWSLMWLGCVFFVWSRLDHDALFHGAAQQKRQPPQRLPEAPSSRLLVNSRHAMIGK